MTVHALHGPQSDQFPSTIKDKNDIRKLKINVTVPSGISNNSDYGNKTTEDTVWRNGGNTTPQSA